MICAVVAVLLVAQASAFSRYYGRCALYLRDKEVSRQPHERVSYARDVNLTFHRVPKKQIVLTNHHLINHKFIGSGSSAEVFLVEDLTARRLFIAKRYLQQEDHRDENHLTKLMGNKIYWTKDHRHGNLISLQPYTGAKNWKLITLPPQQFRIVLFKVIFELNRLHSMGWMHRDIKPLNIAVRGTNNSKEDLSDVRLIDWNGAEQYYLGAKYLERFGTRCYMAPEMHINMKHYTPAADIWSLGVTAYYRYFGKKPLRRNCSKQSFEAVVELVGFQPFMDMYLRYRPQADFETIDKLMSMSSKRGTIRYYLSPSKGESIHLTNFKKLLSRMLVADPEVRATAFELMYDPYFQDMVELTPPGDQDKKQQQAANSSDDS